MAVRIFIQDSYYYVHTKWNNQINVAKLYAAKTEQEELAVLSNIPLELIKQLDEIQFKALYELIGFINDEDVVLPLSETKDITVLPYRLFVKAKSELRQDKLYKKLIGVSGVYYPDQTKMVPILSLGMDIFNQLNIFLETYAEMFNWTPTAEQIKAGISELDVFGDWATIYNLANKDILKMDTVLEQPTISIMTALFYNFKESRYAENLAKQKEKV